MTQPHARDAEELLPLALSRPAEALAMAEALLARTTDPLLASYAHQAAGIVLRDRGEVGAAVRRLRTALRLARASGRTERTGDVRATLGAALVMAGRTRAGLDQLAVAITEAEGTALARVLMRRAYVLTLLGRHAEALEDMRHAMPRISRSGDVAWHARSLNNRADIHLALGAVARAEQDIEAAQKLFRDAGQQLEEVYSLHNRGLVAYRKGDLPGTLALLDEAAERYTRLESQQPELAIDRCIALLAAGLASDARDVAQTALDAPSQPTQRAQLRLMLAKAALAVDDPEQALGSAREAQRAFSLQHRAWWELQARLVALRARDRLPRQRRTGLLDEALTVSNELREAGSDDAPLALLLAGRLAVERGRLDTGRELLQAAAQQRTRGPALQRATGWLARAQWCEVDGDRAGALRASSRGLAALDEHQRSLGSTELRALATSHGRELAAIALRNASRQGPRSLLEWTERWRATALAAPPVRPPQEEALAADLAALRVTVRRIEEEREAGATSHLQRERDRLERSVRNRALHASGADEGPGGLDVGRLLETLGDTALVELVDVDGTLVALLATRGRVRRFTVGPTSEAARAVDQARFVLRRAARGRVGDLGPVGMRLEEAMLGPLASTLPEGPVVVCPPSRLQATPWSLLPSLAVRPVSVTPSAAMWLRMQDVPAPAGDLLVVGGPGLPSGAQEIVDLTSSRPDAIVLRDGTATVERTLAAMADADLLHVVAHGRFRRDNPMFSSLDLDDGPLTVHDLERLDAVPRRVVLSACESGVLAAVGAEEVIGLSTALLTLGATGVVSSVTEVNDEATRSFMGRLHDELPRSGTVAEAVLLARTAAADDPVSAATAASFIAFGS